MTNEEKKEIDILQSKEHTQHIDELIYKVFADDRNGAIIGYTRNAFRKVASAAMKDGFESGYQIGYKSGCDSQSQVKD